MKRLCLIALAGAFACGSDSTPPRTPGALTVVPVATGLSSPLFLTSTGGQDERLFVVEQTGTIRVIKNGQLLATPYLNIASKLTCCGERGLLGLAFHPKFATNGFFYVNYTDVNGNTQIERYHATPSANVADAGSASPVLGFAQPFPNHNGGMLLFGPDNMLWIGTGDGGSGGDPQGNGQKLTTLLGKMLRINVDGTAPYAIPSNNPFVNQAGSRGEIWGLGLRNPWRYAFDHVEGLLYVADVGQGAWEEVHVVPVTTAGVNYGWNTMEGKHCYNAATCNQSGLNIPIIEYSHSDGCSITGGFVYRGNTLPGLRGHYFYSDYCAGFLRSFKYSNGAATEEHEWDIGDVDSVLSFGQDSQGELYLLSSNGTVYRLSP